MLLALALAVPSHSAAQQKKLTYWTHEDPNRTEIETKYIKEFEAANPGVTVGATSTSKGDEQAAFAPAEGEVPLAVGSTLSIDDLVATYSCTLTSTVYSLTAGTTEKKPKQSDTVTITKLDDQH
jgi:hypothetical protein